MREQPPWFPDFASLHPGYGLRAEPPDRLECRIDIGNCMIRADLDPDLLITLGHDGVIEPGSENALAAQMRDHRGGARRVAQHQRHHRMLARQRLEPELDQPFRSEEHTS